MILNATIGKYCAISWNVTIGGANHHINHLSIADIGRIFEDEARSYDRLFTEDLSIGNDVWIASGVNVLRGCSIGDGAIVGAGAVVTKDVLPYSIVAGVPARIIRFRFPEDIIARLCELKWWDISYEVLLDCKWCFEGEFTREKLDYLERVKRSIY